MKEFLGIGGYSRAAEGAMSWQHLLFVTSLMVVMTVLAVVLGKREKRRTLAEKNGVLIAAALLIDGFEIFKIVVLCIRAESLSPVLINLPLFLCSIQLITIPLAAFSKGRVREAALDFVFIFGILGAVLGTYGAGQNYNAYPVLGFTNVVSAITHGISGFASLYLLIAGAAPLTKKEMPITLGILTGFAAVAYGVNHLIDYNYMFLMAGDGTPYDILYNLVGGSPVWYPLLVVVLFYVYIAAFYGVCHILRRKSAKNEKICATV